MLKKNTASQKWIVFAFEGEGGTNPGNPVSGDAANITANLRLDGGAANAVDDTNPTELEDGYYAFDLTQAETNADHIMIAPASATANVLVVGVPGATWTNASTDQTGDSFARLGAPAGASVSADIAAIEAQTDDIGAAGAGLTAVPWNSAWDAEVQSEVNDALVALGLDHLVSTSVAGTDIADDSIIAQMVSSAATADWDTFDNTTDSLQAVRDRGDAAWTTGGGGSISDILQWKVLIPPAIDLANTKAYRIGIALTNMLDDLPTTGEITPGTISIDRSAQGGTSWTSVVADAAMSESAGLIYYDEVFDTGTGYAAGDVLRFTFKGQKITVSANDYEIADGTNGIIEYSGILADTPDVNVAQINGDATAAQTLELFVEALSQGTGQIDSGTFASGAINSSAVADGFLTAAKASSGYITALQSGLATTSALTTVDTVVDAIKAVTDLIPDAGAMNDLAAILADTGTTIPATLGTPAGASLAADVAAVKTTADAVETDTQDIQSRLPASLSNGAIQADIQRINDVALVGDGSLTPFTV